MNKRAIMLFILTIGLVIFLDLLTKQWARTLIQEVEILPFLSWCLACNPGISWGLLSAGFSYSLMLIVSANILIIMGLIWYMMQSHEVFLCSLIIAGAFSNSLDRLANGTVTDFILLHAGRWEFPVFNVADMCIVLGVSALMWRAYYE